MKVVKPVSNDEYSKQTDASAWTVIADIRGNAIPASMELTEAALRHWQEQRASRPERQRIILGISRLIR